MTNNTNPNAIPPQYDELQQIIDGDIDSIEDAPRSERYRNSIQRSREGRIVVDLSHPRYVEQVR